jgi:hypothetical protein
MGGCETGEAWEGGYDHCMFRYLHHPLNFHYARQISGKFVRSTHVINMCEEEYEKRELITKFPSALMVHSKAHMRWNEVRVIDRIFTSILFRRPSSDEILREVVKVYTGEVSVEDLEFKLCSLSERKAFDISKRLCDAAMPLPAWS